MAFLHPGNFLGGGFPYLGKIPMLTNIFQMGWNHQLVLYEDFESPKGQVMEMDG